MSGCASDSSQANNNKVDQFLSRLLGLFRDCWTNHPLDGIVVKDLAQDRFGQP
jgi:hypothetical protein